MLPYNINSSILIERAKLHANRSRDKFEKDYPHAAKKLVDLRLQIKDLRRHSAKILSGALIAGGLVLSSPALVSTVHTTTVQERSAKSPEEVAEAVHQALQAILPPTIGPLHPTQEEQITVTIQNTLGIKATASLHGNRLNTSYGRMGGEQHLPRFAGDTISQHDELQVKGITAGRGAFGYFADSKHTLTYEDEQREKYYVAVQTMYLPNWNQDHKTLKEWFKFRKVLVVNPTTGKSVVAVIADAGPAAWTGKHFGGSPEIMDYLRPFENKNNGAVVLFFVDDIENPIALGPMTGPLTQFVAKK
jgi:hypothetical protein